ncbi:unnamed protein product [Cyclocybe aegerita]|uniref:Uncharacterized protein n=1 Tax=Cyclocybe aegerita TaxID=1973307 RepID=A0A8S0Y0U4_CYCAE|nr:unnamed protein product [Cyclocybe aegerita]
MDLRLPVEIIISIPHFIDGDFKTLAAVALVNRSLCEESRKLLYRTVGWMQDTDPETFPWANPRILSINPALAKYVRTYTVQHFETEEADAILAPLCPGPILDAMVKLEHLDLDIFLNLPPTFLQNCPFQLDSLRWMDTLPFGAGSILYRFLESQTQLRKLEVETLDINSFVKHHPLPQTACPNLQYLKSSYSVIRAILPCRKVSTLVWSSITGSYSPVNESGHLDREFSHLKAFTYLQWYFNVPSISSMARYLANSLQYLKIFYDEDFVLTLPQFTSLMGLIFARQLNGRMLEWPSPLNTGRLFAQCPTLQFIDVQLGTTWSEKFYQRWIPDIDRQVGLREAGQLLCLDIEDHKRPVRALNLA